MQGEDGSISLLESSYGLAPAAAAVETATAETAACTAAAAVVSRSGKTAATEATRRIEGTRGTASHG